MSMLRSRLRWLKFSAPGSTPKIDDKAFRLLELDLQERPTATVAQRCAYLENTLAPSTDEEALQMLRGDINSAAFMIEYARLREEGMGVEQAMIFVGHEFRLRHMRYQPVG
jgi:hypothetical protein